jgi:predicted acylesterase/phospholipase RssA
VENHRSLFFSDCVGVFQGGGCRAVAFAGAYQAAKEAGINFSAVAGTSAGAIVASLIGAGAAPEKLLELLESVAFTEFLVPPERKPGSNTVRFLARSLPKRWDLLLEGGFYSSAGIEAWMNKTLSALLPQVSGLVTFEDLRIPTSVVVTDLLTGTAVVRSTSQNPTEPVAHAVRASCSIPVFFQPVHDRWVDGGVLSNLPVFSVDAEIRERYPRIVAFSLVGAHEPALAKISPVDLARRLANTVVNGSQRLQLAGTENVHVVEIGTDDIRATDFDKVTKEQQQRLVSNGRAAVRLFLDSEAVHVSEARAQVCRDKFASLDVLADLFHHCSSSIQFAGPDTEWVFDLFPALLDAILRGVSVAVRLPSLTGAEPPSEQYRRKLLQYLGVVMVYGPSRSRGFLFDGSSHEGAAFIYSNIDQLHGCVYRSQSGHESVVNLVANDFDIQPADNATIRFTLRGSDPEGLIDRLARINQYRDAHLEVREVDLALVDTYATYSPRFKFIQASRLARTMRDRSLSPYGMVDIVFSNDRRTTSVPPVFEESGGRFVVHYSGSCCFEGHCSPTSVKP